MEYSLLLHTMLLLLGPADISMNQCANPVTQMYNVYESNIIIEALSAGSDTSVYTTGFFVTVLERPVDLDPTTGVDLHANHGGDDFYISKYDSNGNYLWSRSAGGPEDERIVGIVVDSNNNPIAVGSYETELDFDPTEGIDVHTMIGLSTNVFVTKLLSDGSYAWTATFGKGGGVSFGESVAVDESDNIYVVGCFAGTLDFDPTEGEDWHESLGSRGAYITKLWADGTYAWTRSVETSTGDCEEKVEVDSAGGVIVSGGFRGTVDFDPGENVDELTATGQFGSLFVTKYFSDGSYSWTRKMPKVGFAIGAIAVDSNHDIYLASGFEEPDDFDPTEGVDWRSTIFPDTDTVDMYVSKLYSDGSYGWTYSAGGTFGVIAKKMAIDNEENILILGNFSETVDFDSGPQEDIHVALSSTDIFIMKLRPDGRYAWTRSLPGASNDFSRDIDVGPLGNIFFAANSFGTVDINPGCGVDLLPGSVFLVKLGCVEETADANDDGFVDLLDLALFQSCFSSEAPTECNDGCEIFDFDHDDDIDLIDYLEFLFWFE